MGVKAPPEYPWKWRLRAASLRASAQSSGDPGIRATFALLAAAWEEKADRAAAAQPAAPCPAAKP
jgi:hypothetical protein